MSLVRPHSRPRNTSIGRLVEWPSNRCARWSRSVANTRPQSGHGNSGALWLWRPALAHAGGLVELHVSGVPEPHFASSRRAFASRTLRQTRLVGGTDTFWIRGETAHVRGLSRIEVVVRGHAGELEVTVGQDPVVDSSCRGGLDLEARPPRDCPVLPDPDGVVPTGAGAQVVDLAAWDLRREARDDLKDDVGNLLFLDALYAVERVEEARSDDEVRQGPVTLFAGESSGGPLGENQVAEALARRRRTEVPPLRQRAAFALPALRSRDLVDLRSFSARFARRSAWSSR